LFLAYWN